eukprot:15269551-Ditylum_brightwellii.AAC.1
MKISTKRLEFVNHSVGNKPPLIPFYVPDSDKKLKLAVYNLVVKYYKAGTTEEWLQFMEVIAQAIKGQGIQVGDTA